MRTTLPILVALLAGCAPVPPGDVVGGRAEWVAAWTDPAPMYTGEVRICFVDDEGLHVTAGPNGESLTVTIDGDWTQPEWDGSADGYFVRPDGAGHLGYPLACEAHVGTGAGEWIVDVDCAELELDARIVITGCERR